MSSAVVYGVPTECGCATALFDCCLAAADDFHHSFGTLSLYFIISIILRRIPQQGNESKNVEPAF